MENAEVVLVPTKQIIPNTINARKNDNIEVESMVKILQTHGFEEPLTVYKKGKFYVLFGGHRRLAAAKKAKIEQVPVYIREEPKDTKEEMERIASLQSGRVDWTQYEWAKFTYDRWIAWGKPPMTKFSDQINQKKSSVAKYIKVMNYFPHAEIEKDLDDKKLSISSLEALVWWIKNLKKHKPELVEAMTEEMIRKIMLEKLRNKKALRDDLRNKEYLRSASEEQVTEFLTNKDHPLEISIGFAGAKKQYDDFNGHLISIGHMKNRIPNIKVETDLQKEKALESLEELQAMIEEQISKIK